MLELRVKSDIRLTGSSRTGQGRTECHGSRSEPMIVRPVVIGPTTPLAIRCHIWGFLVRWIRYCNIFHTGRVGLELEFNTLQRG